MENSEVGAVPLIVSIVYLSLTVYKSVASGNEKFVRIIPIIASVLGAVLGVAAFYLVPSIMPAANPLSAILIGASSGLASTGTHQIVKLFVSSNTKIPDEESQNKNDTGDNNDSNSDNNND